MSATGMHENRLTKPGSLPLKAPDGEVLTWACGLCRRVAAGPASFGPPDAEMRTDLAEMHKADADACCVCSKCGEVKIGTVGMCSPCSKVVIDEGTARAVAQEEADDRARSKSLEKALDRDAAVLLAQRMSDLSEDCFCAGWMSGLEYSLWDFVLSGPGRWGQGEIGEKDVVELRRLFEKAGGWWRWTEEHGEMFVDKEAWFEIYRSKSRLEGGS